MNSKYTCPECGKECDAVKCDSGIGPYEFWGQKCNQSQPYMGSGCCEAELEDAEWPDDIDERADWEYDRMIDDRLTGD